MALLENLGFARVGEVTRVASGPPPPQPSLCSVFDRWPFSFCLNTCSDKELCAAKGPTPPHPSRPRSDVTCPGKLPPVHPGRSVTTGSAVAQHSALTPSQPAALGSVFPQPHLSLPLASGRFRRFKEESCVLFIFASPIPDTMSDT